ncbi:hypothetical protein [Fibrella arboris]|uniref:hypothetical protein n=1 Tax=Fibrella arboris TaxID=3242486 RepID=UPI003521E76C
MALKKVWSTSLFLLTPLWGIGMFLVLFFWAAYLYPGGSQADRSATGFSWMHNYWCNLLSEQAINGSPNPARPVALTAMVILCVSLSVFWYLLPLLFSLTRRNRRLLQWMGICAMLSSLFIFTAYHDVVIMIASLFGFFALLGTFAGLYSSHLINLFWFGIGCLLLMAVNNYIYYTDTLMDYLPVVQKVTFAVVLFWIAWMTRTIYLHVQQPA